MNTLQKLVVLLWVVVGLIAFSAVGVSQELETQTWLGELDADGNRLRLEVSIVKDEDRLTGSVHSLDQNNLRLEMSDIELGNDLLRFSIPKVKASFSGKSTNHGQSFEGTFIQGQGGTTLVLIRKSKTTQRLARSAEPLQELRETVQWYISEDHAIGAELQIIQSGKSIFHESFGFAHREENRLWENDTICNIRSMTKPITSVAAQILIDRGQLELDVPVATYLKSFDNDKSNAITVRQILTHRSGLPLTNLFGPFQYSSLIEQVNAAGENGPQFKPGEKFWYSDTGTDVVGALVAKVSDEPLNKFVTREIFEPLEMTNTFYGIDINDARLSQAASSYLKTRNGWFRFWQAKRPMYPFAWGSQTVYSTTTDYAKFLGLIINQGKIGQRQLLSRQAIERMLEPVSRMKRLGSDANFPTGFKGVQPFYGQMMVTYRTIGNIQNQPQIIGHSGSDGTNSWAWPDKDLIIVYFTQSRGGKSPLTIEYPIDRLIIHPVQQESAAEHLQPYLGVYIANYADFEDEEFTISARDGNLFLDVPSQMVYELISPDEEGFWAFAIAPTEVKAAFNFDKNGSVIGLKLHKAGHVYDVPKRTSEPAADLDEKGGTKRNDPTKVHQDN